MRCHTLHRREILLLALSGFAVSACHREAPFPPENTPEGAYARIAVAISEGRPRDVFPYLEDEAQWACHTIHKERAAALERARASYPPDALAPVVAAYTADAQAEAAEVFVRIAKARGWIARLRRDLSGVAHVETQGDRATLVTARGSRHPMKRRSVGIWGLTAFTAELGADAERATRDHLRVEQAASDYELSAGKRALDAATDSSK